MHQREREGASGEFRRPVQTRTDAQQKGAPTGARKVAADRRDDDTTLLLRRAGRRSAAQRGCAGSDSDRRSRSGRRDGTERRTRRRENGCGGRLHGRPRRSRSRGHGNGRRGRRDPREGVAAERVVERPLGTHVTTDADINRDKLVNGGVARRRASRRRTGSGERFGVQPSGHRSARLGAHHRHRRRADAGHEEHGDEALEKLVTETAHERGSGVVPDARAS